MSASRNGQLLASSIAGLLPYARLGWIMSCMMYAARCSAWTICTDRSCVREITVPLSSTAGRDRSMVSLVVRKGGGGLIISTMRSRSWRSPFSRASRFRYVWTLQRYTLLSRDPVPPAHSNRILISGKKVRRHGRIIVLEAELLLPGEAASRALRDASTLRRSVLAESSHAWDNRFTLAMRFTCCPLHAHR